ncbi:DUF6172 family protein [Colwelliaceae bacterium 6441]
MKKTFQLTHPKIKPARMVDAIKSEIKKYVKRERNKALPTDADYWDFDCKFGLTEQTADEVHLSAINKAIDEVVKGGEISFYVEIMVRAANRQYIEPIENNDEEDEEDA